MPKNDLSDIPIAVERIITSGALGQGERRRSLLRYIVEEELEGRGNSIKAYSIALDVFGRSASFDPSADNIVRVEIGRLRQCLSHYYNSVGSDDETIISIPKGSYRPVVLARQIDATHKAPNKKKDQSELAVVVIPFEALHANPESLGLARGLSNQLFAALARTKILRLVHPDKAVPVTETAEMLKTVYAQNVKYALRGTLQSMFDSSRVDIELLSGLDGHIVWARSYELDTKSTSEIQNDLVRRIVTDLRPIIFNSERAELENRPVDELNPDEIFLLTTWVLGNAMSSLKWEMRRIELAKRALTLQPNSGKAHSVLADKLVYLSSIDPTFDSEENLEAAAHHASKAAEFSPNDPDVFFNLTMHHWHSGSLDLAEISCLRVLDLDPSNGLAHLMSFCIPYTSKVAPQEILKRVEEYDASLSTDNPVRWFCMNWMARILLNSERYAESLNFDLRANQFFHTPDASMRAATSLFKLGRFQDAVSLVDSQFQNWPTYDPFHLANVSLRRRRRQYEEEDAVLKAYLDFAIAYRAEAGKRIVRFRT